LDLSFCDKITDAAFIEVDKGCPSLVDINISRCRLTDHTLDRLAKGCPALSVLSIRWCGDITDSGIAAVAAGCPFLQKLSLTQVDISDDGLACLASLPLHHLDLSWCASITDRGIISMFSSSQSSLASSSPSLIEYLDLSMCERLTDISLQYVSQNCPRLYILKLDKCTRLTDESLRALCHMQQLSSLQTLSLRWCHNFSHSALHKLIQVCQTLESLAITNCLGLITSSRGGSMSMAELHGSLPSYPSPALEVRWPSPFMSWGFPSSTSQNSSPSTTFQSTSSTPSPADVRFPSPMPAGSASGRLPSNLLPSLQPSLQPCGRVKVDIGRCSLCNPTVGAGVSSDSEVVATAAGFITSESELG